MYQAFNKVKIIYIERKNFFNPFIILGFSFAVLYTWLEISPLLGWVIFYIPTIIYVLLNYKKIVIVGKKWITILLGFGGLFFISKIYADKLLNYHYGIEHEYLNYSATIYAVLLAILLGSFIVFLSYLLPYLLRSMWYGIASYFTIKYREKTQSLGFYFEPFIVIGLIMPVTIVSGFAEKFTNYYLIADAYPISSCGEKLDNVLYIRKNSEQCYLIQLQVPLILEEINSPAK